MVVVERGQGGHSLVGSRLTRQLRQTGLQPGWLVDRFCWYSCLGLSGVNSEAFGKESFHLKYASYGEAQEESVGTLEELGRHLLKTSFVFISREIKYGR